MAKAIYGNPTAKALQAFLAKAKKTDPVAMYEWLLACNTSPERGHVYDQHEIMTRYSRRGYDGDTGATKVCHKEEYVVVKRAKYGAWVFHGEGSGNQLIDEIACWRDLASKPEADLLCPILKYFTSKSDKVTATSNKMFNNVIIIAQKAVFVSYAELACAEAEALNRKCGFRGESADRRLAKMKALSRAMGWRDALDNRGNSGVIFDYDKGCYKAVFIDYAL